jgi:iron(III) transport system ATP-binding protein
MSVLSLKDVQVDYPLGGDVYRALKGLSLDIEAGEFFTLLGPSGCGKTTALRSIAGLERPTRGAIDIGGKTVFSATRGIMEPPNRRDISMVFQSYAIWPHMTVGENVAFPLDGQGLSRAERDAKVARALDLVGLSAHGDRSAPLLSGGQQQRVALARALVKGGKLLLLDEPLSNLDAKLRDQMRVELRDIQRRVGTTAIYVTHDQDEAMSMSDRIALMQAGDLVEIGTPEALYLAPTRRFTAEFLGRALILPVQSIGPCETGWAVYTAIGRIEAATHTELGARAKSIAIRPEHVMLSQAPVQSPNCWAGRIVAREFAGRIVDYRVAVEGAEIGVQTTSRELLLVGSEVTVTVPANRCLLLSE